MADLERVSSYFRPRPSSLTIGTKIERGSYGVVYEGKLEGLPVAVKRIPRRLLEMDKSVTDAGRIVRDFEAECRLLEGLKHPHIVGFSGAFYDAQSEEPLLVMERLKENLRDLLGRVRELSLLRQLKICLGLASGLEYLHSRSPLVAHRNLYDKDVMLSEQGVVKIIDFGPSKLERISVLYDETRVDGKGEWMAFMPPEGLLEMPHDAKKTDMFSLGVLMLEICTGCPPSVTLFGIGLESEIERRAEDLSKLDDGHPLKPFILQCLSYNYKQRPSAVTVRSFIESQVVSGNT